MIRSFRPGLFFLIAMVFAGCSPATPGSRGGSSVDNARVSRWRDKFLLSEAPTGAVAIAEAKKGLAEKTEVVLTGRIGAGKHDPWEKGKAAFVISDAVTDPSGHATAPGHDAENCPFCKRRAASADTTAIVQFVDERGEVITVDARDLLQAEKDQIVVVKGRGEVNALGTLVVSANGIYLQRE